MTFDKSPRNTRPAEYFFALYVYIILMISILRNTKEVKAALS